MRFANVWSDKFADQNFDIAKMDSTAAKRASNVCSIVSLDGFASFHKVGGLSAVSVMLMQAKLGLTYIRVNNCHLEKTNVALKPLHD